MSDRPRWLVVLVVALIIGALVAMARGREHHRGDEVGAMAAEVSASD
jgi:hypothetical protein